MSKIHEKLVTVGSCLVGVTPAQREWMLKKASEGVSIPSIFRAGIQLQMKLDKSNEKQVIRSESETTV